MRTLSRVRFAVALVLCLFVALAVTCTAGTWISEGTSPLAGGYGEGAIATADDVYILECQDASSRCYFYSFSVTDAVWRQESTNGLETGFFRNGTALAWNGATTIYALAGARYSDSNRTEFVRYDIGNAVWVGLCDTPIAQGAGNALTWSGYDSALYAFVGSSGHNGGTSEFLRYDVQLDQWAILASPWRNTDDGASLTWDGGTHIYALRGEFDEVQPNGEFARFDLVTMEWQILAELPDPLGVGDGASILSTSPWESVSADYIYALSGGSASEAPGDRFFRYQVSTDQWEEMPSIPCPIGFYVGRRLVYTQGKLYYWQGSPTSEKWLCGGDGFFSMEVGTSVAMTPVSDSESEAAQGTRDSQIATLSDGTRVVLHDDFTWEYDNEGYVYDFDFSALTPETLPSFLRPGRQADVATQSTAVEMYLQGWRYMMPAPKSAQAAWGNSDGRTTWWYGYWYNVDGERHSASQPTVSDDCEYRGDGQNLANTWRNGGSPSHPTLLEWLLSEYGGPPSG